MLYWKVILFAKRLIETELQQCFTIKTPSNNLTKPIPHFLIVREAKRILERCGFFLVVTTPVALKKYVSLKFAFVFNLHTCLYFNLHIVDKKRKPTRNLKNLTCLWTLHIQAYNTPKLLCRFGELKKRFCLILSSIKSHVHIQTSAGWSLSLVHVTNYTLRVVTAKLLSSTTVNTVSKVKVIKHKITSHNMTWFQMFHQCVTVVKVVSLYTIQPKNGQAACSTLCWDQCVRN